MTVMKYKKSIFDADPEKEWQMDELLTEEGADYSAALVDRQKKGGTDDDDSESLNEFFLSLQQSDYYFPHWAR